MKRTIVLAMAIIAVLAANTNAGTQLTFNRVLAEETVGAVTGFAGGMVSMGLWMAVSGGNTGNMKIADYVNSYVFGSMAAGAFGVYYTGRYGGDKGGYLFSLAGSFCGTLLGYIAGAGKDKNFALYYAVLLPLLQGAGAVCGFNFDLIAGPLFTKNKKGVKASVPAIRITGDAGYLTASMEICRIFF